MRQTMTVKEVATQLGISEQGIRVGLQRGTLPFGYAVKSVSGNGWRYIIPKEKFKQYMGVKNDE